MMSGVLQGSVLASIMSAVYISDMEDGVSSYVIFCADDAKLLRHVNHVMDWEVLQGDLDRIQEWSGTWQMKLNI